MKKRLLWFLLFSAFYAWFGRDGVRGQSTQIAADCQIPFSIDVSTAPARVPSAGFSNKTKQCGTWVLSYQAASTVSAISLRLDSATDTAGAAGTWGAFSGTTITGSNPITTVPNSFFAGQGNPAWVSVRLTSATGTGTITGYAYGWIIPPQVYTSGSSGGPTANVNVAQYGGTNVSLGQAAMAASMPVAIASDQSAVKGQGAGAAGAALTGNPMLAALSDGTNARDLKGDTQGNLFTYLGCTSQAEVSLSGTGYVEIVAGTAAQIIKVCKIFVTSASGGAPSVNTFSVARATVTTCGTATELLSAAGITGIDSDFGGALQSGSGQSICVSEATANSDKVTITYQKAAF